MTVEPLLLKKPGRSVCQRRSPPTRTGGTAARKLRPAYPRRQPQFTPAADRSVAGHVLHHQLGPRREVRQFAGRPARRVVQLLDADASHRYQPLLRIEPGTSGRSRTLPGRFRSLLRAEAGRDVLSSCSTRTRELYAMFAVRENPRCAAVERRRWPGTLIAVAESSDAIAPRRSDRRSTNGLREQRPVRWNVTRRRASPHGCIASSWQGS